MGIRSVSCIYFSPTGASQKIAETIAKGMQVAQIEHVDGTQVSVRRQDARKINTDVAIIAMPVYYGRIPELATAFIRCIEGQGRPAVLVAVYGNREYEDALLELQDLATSQAFVPVACGAFVAEHSYSSPSRPIAAGRPDGHDLQKAFGFGIDIGEKLRGMDSLAGYRKILVPGNYPYLESAGLEMIKQARKEIALTPDTDASLCSQCQLCSEACPTAAISPADVSKVDKEKCIICFACVKACPEQAKQLTEPHFNQAIDQLQQACQDRKEPEVYF